MPNANKYLGTPLVALETTLQFLVDKTIYTFLFVKMKYRSVHFTIVFDNLLSKKNNYCVVYERDCIVVSNRGPGYRCIAKEKLPLKY